MSTLDGRAVGPSLQERAEAAAWLARLRGPDRDAEIERGFRRWLQARPAHEQAFQQLTERLEIVERMKTRPLPHSWRSQSPRPKALRMSWLLAAACAIAAFGAAFLLRESDVSTRVGEQRMLTLEDGTRVYLNTDTRLVVRYSDDLRGIELKSGEALFEVSKDPNRSFAVSAGSRQVQAIGTAFVVRRNDDELTVTLLEGKVRVVEPSGEAGVGSADPARNGFAAARQTPLSPGQRLTVTPSGGSTVDEPALDKVTAWRRGQVAIDDLSLAEAVREMNRYSPVKLVVADAAAGNLRVGGFFRIGDSRGFASAVAATYHLRLIEENDQIVMTTQ